MEKSAAISAFSFLSTTQWYWELSVYSKCETDWFASVGLILILNERDINKTKETNRDTRGTKSEVNIGT